MSLDGRRLRTDPASAACPTRDDRGSQTSCASTFPRTLPLTFPRPGLSRFRPTRAARDSWEALRRRRTPCDVKRRLEEIPTNADQPAERRTPPTNPATDDGQDRARRA